MVEEFSVSKHVRDYPMKHSKSERNVLIIVARNDLLILISRTFLVYVTSIDFLCIIEKKTGVRVYWSRLQFIVFINTTYK